MIYVPLASSDIYNWKLQKPLFSERPLVITGLLDSIMLTHQPTWDDCQQLLQVLFMTEKREKIVGATWKLVMGTNRLPTKVQAYNNAAFHFTCPNWDF